jgi:prefoldin subunit 4
MITCAFLLVLVFQSETDAQVTLDDQQKINKFARHNAKLQDIKDELKQKQVR